MHFSTTDGGKWDISDMCAYCSMTTGGQHEAQCPYSRILKEGYQKLRIILYLLE